MTEEIVWGMQRSGTYALNGEYSFAVLFTFRILIIHAVRVNVLMNELKVDQAANERGACLEAVSAILER